jgi:predicted AlkP superfamily pyrophosphatase or phosphodiesterase
MVAPNPRSGHRCGWQRWAGLCLLAPLAVTGCGVRMVSSPAIENAASLRPASAITSHLVIISVDGLRPDAIGAYDTPNFHRLIREGSYTLEARTILPSKTLPSHTSMLTGEGPDRHGVLWNNIAMARKDTVEIPTIFGVARTHGYQTAAFFSKPKFNAIQQPGTLDFSQAPGSWFAKWSVNKTTTDVERYLASVQPNVLFVHLAEPDTTGHRSGWMSAAYGRAVTEADAGVGRIMAAAARAFGDGNYTLIVTSDHGGHDGDHGQDDERDVTIPWMAWGRGVKPGRLPAGGIVNTVDTASTSLWLLGLREPTDWAGAPVLAAFAAGSSQ